MLPAFWMHSRNFMLKVSWWLKRNLKQIQANYHSLLLGVWVSHRERMDPPLCGKTAILMFLLMPSSFCNCCARHTPLMQAVLKIKEQFWTLELFWKLLQPWKEDFGGHFAIQQLFFTSFLFFLISPLCGSRYVDRARPYHFVKNLLGWKYGLDT